MLPSMARYLARSSFAVRRRAVVSCGALFLASILAAASAQEPVSAQQPAQPNATTAPAQSDATQAPAPAPSQQAPETSTATTADAQATPKSEPAQPGLAQPEPAQPGGITEDDLKKLLVGKQLYLRGGYLDDNLGFNEHGVLTGHSPQGSYTLTGVAIERVRLTKHKVELEGQRYGLHFLGALPSEDPTTAMDRVLITPKKKVLRITIDRETVVTPKKVKEVKEVKEKDKSKKAAPPLAAAPSAAAGATPAPATAEPNEPSDAEQAKADMAAAPAAERPADPASVTTTTSPAHAAALLKDAIDHIFSVGFDVRMMAAMPDFWKLYYQAVAAKADYRPKDPAVLRQSAVDKKARLVSVFEPASNEFAQAHGVAGLALYHVVIGADGKPGEIAVARPIGFGLDESAADSIRKASFEPAIKDGKPVPVLLDLIVEFHIYSARTGASSKPETHDSRSTEKDNLEASNKPAAGDQPAALLLPGPYSVPHH
jgi:outer membrane biosynthesis protein TonB